MPAALTDLGSTLQPAAGTEKSIATHDTKRHWLRTMLGLSRHELSIYQSLAPTKNVETDCPASLEKKRT